MKMPKWMMICSYCGRKHPCPYRLPEWIDLLTMRWKTWNFGSYIKLRTSLCHSVIYQWDKHKFTEWHLQNTHILLRKFSDEGDVSPFLMLCVCGCECMRSLCYHNIWFPWQQPQYSQQEKKNEKGALLHTVTHCSKDENIPTKGHVFTYNP